MRVRIAYTTTVDDDYRRALRHRFGQHGTLATRAEVRDHLWANGRSMDDDLMWEVDGCDEGCNPEAPEQPE